MQILSLAASIVLTASTATLLAAPAYEIAALPEPPNTNSSYAYGINDLGDVIGDYFLSSNAPDRRPALWRDRQFADLFAELPDARGSAFALSDAGAVVGVLAPEGRAYLWSGGNVSYPAGEHQHPSAATVINDGGTFAGIISANGSIHAAVASKGQLVAIPSARPLSTPSAINNHGTIIGHYLQNTNAQPYIYENGTVRDLLPDGFEWMSVYDLNGSGEIPFFASVQGQRAGGILKNGAVRFLDPLPGDDEAHPYRINAAGWAIGYSLENTNGSARPTIWAPGSAIALNLHNLIDPQSGWTYLTVHDINASGQIVGGGYFNNSSEQHAFLMNPVPETTGALLSAWVLGMGYFGRRRR